MAIDIKKIGMIAADAVAVNAGGYLFTKIDPIIDKNISYLNPNSSKGLGKDAKYAKAALYSGIGVALDYFLTERGGVLEQVAKYGSQVLYGLGAGTIAGDPVIQTVYKTADVSPSTEYVNFPAGSVIS